MVRYRKNGDKIKISPLLDDKAYDVAEIIKELGLLQYKYFDNFVESVKENKLLQGLSDEEVHDWLAYYIFNSISKENRKHYNSNPPEKKFKEYLLSYDCLINHHDL